MDLLFNTQGHTQNNRRYSRYIHRTMVESREVLDWLRRAGESSSRMGSVPSGVDLEHQRPREKPSETARRSR